jgi:hypothetical protein
MRKFMMGCLGVVTAVVVTQFAQAEVKANVFEDPCAEVSVWGPCDVAFGGTKKKSKWFVNGYLEAGFFANEYGQKNVYRDNSGYDHNIVEYGNGGNNLGWGELGIYQNPLQNVKNTGGQLNQLYISLGKSVDGSRGWDFGGTVDFTFGTDASIVQAAGLEYGAGHGNDSWGTGDYYSAFAQAYFEAEYKKWNFKVGKFYAPFGSNGYQSTSRFFYSLADTFAFVPATASGGYATYTVNDKLAVYGGWVQPDQFGETSDDNAFLGGIVWQASNRLNLHYALALGKNTVHGADVNYFVNSLVATYQINKKWKYIFDWSLKNVNDHSYDYNDDYVVRGINYGINNELIYQYNSKWAFGVRAGWTHEGSSESASSQGDNFYYWNYGNKYTFSVGANWTPTKWLVVKPELRYDVFDNDRRAYKVPNGSSGSYSYKPGVFDRGTAKDQLSGGVSAIVKF